MLAIGLIVASAIAGAVIFRVRGGFGPDFPGHRPITLGSWSALLTAPLWFLCPWYVVVAAFALVMGATSLPHGSGIDFGHNPADDPTELWRHLWAPKDSMTHDAIFMAVRGGLMTLPVGAAMLFSTSPVWAFVGFTGGLMGASYLLAWRMTENGAEIGEWLTGASVSAVCALLWVAV
jgi:hypothetical protein